MHVKLYGKRQTAMLMLTHTPLTEAQRINTVNRNAPSIPNTVRLESDRTSFTVSANRALQSNSGRLWLLHKMME